MKKICTNNGQFNITDALYEAINNNADEYDALPEDYEYLTNLLKQGNSNLKKVINSLDKSSRELLNNNFNDLVSKEFIIPSKKNGTWNDFKNGKTTNDENNRKQFIETYSALVNKIIEKIMNNNEEEKAQNDGYTINYDFPTVKKVMEEYFSKYQDTNNFSQLNNDSNEKERTTISDQTELLKKLRAYINNGMSFMGRIKSVDYILTSGKTEYSLNYERENRDDRTILNDLSDRLIGKNLYNTMENELKPSVTEAASKDIQIIDKNKATFMIDDNKSTNIIDVVADLFYKFFKGWFYRFTETLNEKTPYPFRTKYSNKKNNSNDYMLFCIDKITYKICRKLFYKEENNQQGENNINYTAFGQYIVQMRGDKKMIEKAENLFYLNIICFNKDTYSDIYDYFTSRPSISSKNQNSELSFKTERVKRVKNVSIKTIQVYIKYKNYNNGNNGGRNIMLCNLDIIYFLSKAKPFIDDLKSIANGFSKYLNSGSQTNKL